MLPATKRGRSFVENFAHAARATSAPRRLSSRVHATISASNSAPTSLFAPKVSVSTTSAPASEEVLVDALDHVRPALHQDVGAVVATEVVRGRAVGARVDARSHRAVEHQDLRMERVEEAAAHGEGK